MNKTLVAGSGLLVLASACGSPAGTAASAARTAPASSATPAPASPTPSLRMALDELELLTLGLDSD